ncbi:MAG: hypothetical protein OHK93_003764 [Ramalina farinacea]|uniref:Uncharacterized protein n=1 Tax=Ramalina farinacea TaxID=258253 RepID=A0AA43QTZ2_9LECA|nr:hypothetical protein [Ramalina farinacea]
MYLLKTLPLLSLITAGLAHPLLDATVPSILSERGLDELGQLGQFASPGCSGKITSDTKKWVRADGHPATVAQHVIRPNPGLIKGACFPWYPVLDQQNGPSVGINFGSNFRHIDQVQFFKSTRGCAIAEAAAPDAWYPPEICCHKDQGGLLGMINANGTDSDFGATKDMGFKGSMCAQIGPGHNQSLWEMKYFITR